MTVLGGEAPEGAVERIQVLMKAICLRRLKSTVIDGEPIIPLPQKTIQQREITFSPEEQEFYQSLEERIRLRVNKYVVENTVMKNYTNVLVLLLRLRQACCHPSLVANDFSRLTPEELEEIKLEEDRRRTAMEAALEMAPEVVLRLLEKWEEDGPADDCPICLDETINPMIIPKCGHTYCKDCLKSLSESRESRCPECRGEFAISAIISVKEAMRKYGRLETREGEAPEEEKDDAADGVGAEPDAFIGSSKTNELMWIMDDIRMNHRNDKVIVFSQFRKMLDLCETPLREKNFLFERYDGKMSATERDEALKRFRKFHNIKVILVSLKCGALGLNLTVANRVVIMDPWWNPAVENQAIDRVHRFGQTKEVTVYKLTIKST
ncbi:hypothetical protein HK101_006043, partial [Irineochytrium annulatum]